MASKTKTSKKLTVYPFIYTALIAIVIVLSVLILQRLYVIPLFPFQEGGGNPTPTKVLLNYNNLEHNFSLKFPQYWLDQTNRQDWVTPDPTDPATTPAPPDPLIVTLSSPMYEHPDAKMGTTINITATTIPPEQAEVTLDGFITESEQRLKASSEDYQRLSLETKTISGLPAVVLVWSRNTVDTIITRQAAFLKNGKMYVITYSSLKAYDADYSSAFDLVTSTFTFKS